MYIRDRENKQIKCRALLDTCATANFISETVTKRLNIDVIAHSSSIGTINSMNTESKGIVQINIDTR